MSLPSIRHNDIHPQKHDIYQVFYDLQVKLPDQPTSVTLIFIFLLLSIAVKNRRLVINPYMIPVAYRKKKPAVKLQYINKNN